MIDLELESPVTLRYAARLPQCRRNGKPLHLATLFRWAQRGIRGVKLETVTQGGARVTTAEAIERFFAALADPNANISPSRTPTQRQRAHEKAEANLAKAGW